MLSAILFINLKGDTIIQRYFRDDIPPSAAEAFRQMIAAGTLPPTPIVMCEDCSFLYFRSSDVYVITITRRNANPMIAYEFMNNVVRVFVSYFGTKFNEEAIRNNFVLIYELLDEMMDHGYPQLTSLNQLQSAISLGTTKGGSSGDPISDKKKLEKITSFITGGVDWREPGKHVYKKNEVFMDVLEAVNVLMSSDGTVLRSDVSGKIVMKTHLSGMPECKIGLNDKLLVDGVNPNVNAIQSSQSGRNRQVAVEDMVLHRCVNLAQSKDCISFVPPDGEFALAKYRITNQIRLPFSITPNVVHKGRSRVYYEIVLRANFDPHLSSLNLRLTIPVPPNTASINVQTTHGSAKLKSIQNAIVWKVPKCAGGSTLTLRGDAILAATIEDKVWNKPPITVNFDLPMFCSSGLAVKYLKIVEPRTPGYQSVKWIRYMTKAGNYAIRM